MKTLFGILLLLTGSALGQESPHGPLDLQCADCHSTSSWKQLKSPLEFDHDTTAFPLRGQHRYITCRSCHTTLRFTETSPDCFACHKKDYDGALAINHQAAGFSTDCLECHNRDVTSWLTTFNHDRTSFPIRGIHQSLPCKACHVDNRFRGTPVECVACHRQQYLAATNPNHITAGFSTDCATCHRALTWQPAAFFPHDSYFPISAGSNHSPGRWNSCVDCHPAQPNYATFECINCHAHTKSAMDSRHSEVRGYQYLSTSCYHCHPTGSRGGD